MWHYRRRDEKLIAPSNEFLFRPNGRMMTTFLPPTAPARCASNSAHPQPASDAPTSPPVGEVRRAVDLMLDHARTQIGAAKPQSLGVIAFGQKHSARIEREFEQRLLDEGPDVRSYFAQAGNEKYFIENIEHVQGGFPPRSGCNFELVPLQPLGGAAER